MEIGLILALLAAVCYAGGMTIVRKVVSQTGESFTSVITSVFIGILYFLAAILISGKTNNLWYISWGAILILAAAGIIHFVAGRLLGYNAYRLIGANKASAFTRTTPFYTLTFGALFLNEPLTPTLILGVLCIFSGAMLVGTERKSVSEGTQGRFSGTELKGILAALGSALCWGISPVLIRSVVGEIGSPSAAAFVSYVAASIVIAFLLFRRRFREQLVQLRSSATLIRLVIAGLFVSTAQLLTYTALSLSPASMVTPLVSTSILFLFLLSFLLNRNIEVFTLKVILGMAAAVAGTFLIFY